MTDICKVSLKTIEKSDNAIVYYHSGNNWIHIKCSKLDKLDYEILKDTKTPWFCNFCT